MLVCGSVHLHRCAAEIYTNALSQCCSPHSETQQALQHCIANEWNHSYSREKAGNPAPWISLRGKVWPAVGRIDQAYGDRNLVCTCPPMEDYLDTDSNL